MSSIDKQKYFREFVQKNAENIPNLSGIHDFDSDCESIWKIRALCSMPAYLKQQDCKPFEKELELCQTFSLLEPLYLETLDIEEKRKYLVRKNIFEDLYKKWENEALAEQKKIKQELEEKLKEREILIAETEEIDKGVAELDKKITEQGILRKKRKNTLKIGCTVPFILVLLPVATTQNQTILRILAILLILWIAVFVVRVTTISIKKGKLERENVNAKQERKNADAQKTALDEKRNQLEIRINELQKKVTNN